MPLFLANAIFDIFPEFNINLCCGKSYQLPFYDGYLA
ncbi:hypothetical protein SPAB_03806 [Salmonella enterica subsp. enterica serovar Paratyphi B str. SPB7]|uniref:Uncharacterized protein n=1 Tax=Salmonella paratyphi B (strain ATCC BAA-1250 / SPB7) TaxID=1016998 RepID=A0A6C6Z5M8_SALPB|nr:hypothetical protein SPAB_03806 [Salmonella enterica subsp. enterica serovar Paratyphi B str. SPB7]